MKLPSCHSVLVLYDYSHGGQIAPFGKAFVTPLGSGSYLYGWYRNGKHFVYVTRGIGTTPGLLLRTGANPELITLDLVKVSV